MNGAESLIRTALNAGVDTWFTNPGTTELPLVDALDAVKEVRAVLCLFEGVCSGAADGYGRMMEKPAIALTHLGPGFANSVANLHNARRARTPIVNVIGNQTTTHVVYDAPLTSDIDTLARPVSAWVRESKTASAMAPDVAEAVAVASRVPGQVATLICPTDCQWNECNGVVDKIKVAEPERVGDEPIKKTAELLRKYGANSLLLLGGYGLRERGLKAAARIAAKTGCLLAPLVQSSRTERGGAMPTLVQVPGFYDLATDFFRKSNVRAMVIAGSRSPVSSFGYRNVPSLLTPTDVVIETLVNPLQDIPYALEALADELGAPREAPAPKREPPQVPTGPLNPATIAAAIAAFIPEGAIVVDEAVTTAAAFIRATNSAPRHTVLNNTGGAIGQGMPTAVGAAVACPDRKVISFQADGSAMYTSQALWTQAREQLNITTIICNNRCYRILQNGLARAGITEPGPVTRSLLSLDQPEINFTKLAGVYGIPAVRVETADELVAQLKRAIPEHGPNLIEMML